MSSLNLHNYDKKSDLVIKRIRELPCYGMAMGDTQLIGDILTKRGVGDVWNCLINDVGKLANYDMINMISVDELLGVVCYLWSNDDFKKVFTEQLIDMRSGMCPPGRTLRLCQVIDAFVWLS